MFGNPEPALISMNQTCTRTYCVERPNKRLLAKLNTNRLITELEWFNTRTKDLREAERSSLYHTFYIPKKSRGFRRIDAPKDTLMMYLRDLKLLFEDVFGALYHTSAFAYIKGRCTIDAVKRHQQNKSRWFARYDFSNFFGSTTKEFVMKMLSSVYPFSEVVATPRGRNALETAIDLAFLDGVLPQGTPISPLITNVMMIPIDYVLANRFRDFDKHNLVYTRYADDILVSCEYDFSFRNVEAEINKVLAEFGAPFKIKNEKTRYGSSSGSNWNLGVMLNKENKITVGAKRKRELKSMLSNFILDTQNDKPWDKSDIMILEGYRNYYRMVEMETIDGIVDQLNKKYGVDVVNMLKAELKM